MFAVDSNSDVISSSPPAQPSRSPFDDVTTRAHGTFTEMSDVEESWRTLAQLHAAAAAAVQSNWNQELLRTATVAAAYRSSLNDTLQHDVMSVNNTAASSSSSNNNNNNNNAVTRPKTIARESTSTLKAWLLEHIKNPYPSKGEKIMLAVMTRMTLTQVSTWFANARRRLKKDERVHWRDEEEEEEEEDAERDAEGPEEDYSSDCMDKENTELDAECRAVDGTIGSRARKSNENKRSEADDKPLTSSLTSSAPPNTPRTLTPSPVAVPASSVPGQSCFFSSPPVANCFPFPVATPGISPLHIQRLFQFSMFAAAARCRDVTPTSLSQAAVPPRVDCSPTGTCYHQTKPKIWSIVDLVSTDNNNNNNNRSSSRRNDDVSDSINGRYEHSRTDGFSSGDSNVSVDDL